jgi:hypothetical protein
MSVETAISDNSESSFLDTVKENLKEKKKISDTSCQVYLRNLKKLNGGKAFDNFDFLKEVEETLKQLDSFKETTKRNYLISIVSVLGLYPEQKETHDKYHQLMMQKKEEIEKKSEDLTKTQEDNWVNWQEVKDQLKLLEEKVAIFYKKKQITDDDFLVLLSYLILALYVLIPPRRNKDYSLMRVVQNFTPDLSTDFNYYDLTKKKFIFNNYKTSKKYGRYDLSVPNALKTVINKYLKHRASKFALDDQDNKPFLIRPDGTVLDKSNSITKVLNKVFGKSIGSSMLRHIFLSDKYLATFKASKLDAEQMAHSPAEQKKYVKEKLTVVL